MACSPSTDDDQPAAADISATSTSSESTGYALALGPPLDDDVADACQAAADYLGFGVPCPTALPGVARVGCRSGSELRPAPCVYGDGFILEPIIGGLPDGYDPGSDGPLHLVIEATRSGRVCVEEGSTSATVVVRGTQGTLFECGEIEGLHAGHTMVTWADGDAVFSVSFHGHGAERRDAVLAIVNSVERIDPGA